MDLPGQLRNVRQQGAGCPAVFQRDKVFLPRAEPVRRSRQQSNRAPFMAYDKQNRARLIPGSFLSI
jgi:hypothetical protein